MPVETPKHLQPSDLGSKSYWDACYEKEIQNFQDNPEDEGTVWFSDSGAEDKMIEYLDRLEADQELSREDSDSRIATSFLDLGTGNGHLLFALRNEGWTGKMLGLDYSQASIDLACRINDSRCHDAPLQSKNEVITEEPRIKVDFLQYDILAPQIEREVGQFDVVLDKGTFDAISLSSATDLDGKRTCERYRTYCKPFVRDGGLLVITSCNWTEEELKTWFLGKHSDEDGEFVLKDKLRYPTFRFQGQEGQSVVTLCFEKRKMYE